MPEQLRTDGALRSEEVEMPEHVGQHLLLATKAFHLPKPLQERRHIIIPDMVSDSDPDPGGQK